MSSSDKSSQHESRQPKKRAHRVSRACDFCHSRSIRCRPSDNDTGPCQSCIEYQRQCTYNRPSKKRGVKSSSQRSPDKPVAGFPSLDSDSYLSINPQELLDKPTLLKLADVYFETIYPMFPFFHRQTLFRRIEAEEYLQNAPCSAVMISMCALTVARIRDNAPYSNKWNTQEFNALPSSELFVSTAHDIIPKDARASGNLDYLRCCALLALTGIQNGKFKEFHFWLGIYCMTLRLDSLQNEESWPKGIPKIEVEERRRLFWSMYSLEIFSSACFETPMYCREEHSRVSYPEEIDDDILEETSGESHKLEVSERSTAAVTHPRDQISWFQGWNFVIDLYRVLEHAIDQRRAKEAGPSPPPTATLFRLEGASPQTIITQIMNLYQNLPKPFKEIAPLTFNQKRDIFGFQGANITATIQLVRMVLFAHDQASVGQLCSVIREVLQTFTRIPMGYLKAISTPLVVHLGGIGRVLGSIAKRPLPEPTYDLVRSSLYAHANLLSNLGKGTLVGEEPSRHIINQIERMDAIRKSHSSVPGSEKSFIPSPAGNPFSPSSYETVSPTALRPSFPILPSPPQSSRVANNKAGPSGIDGGNQYVVVGGPNAEPSGAHLQALADNGSGQYNIPPAMLDDWSWAFDFTQQGDNE